MRITRLDSKPSKLADPWNLGANTYCYQNVQVSFPKHNPGLHDICNGLDFTLTTGYRLFQILRAELCNSIVKIFSHVLIRVVPSKQLHDIKAPMRQGQSPRPVSVMFCPDYVPEQSSWSVPDGGQCDQRPPSCRPKG